MLEGLVTLGVRQAVLTSNEGLVIESVGKRSPEPELLAAELATLVRSGRKLTSNLGGNLRRFTLATEERELLVVVFGEYCLGAVVDRGTDRKGVGNELSRLAMRLAQQL